MTNRLRKNFDFVHYFLREGGCLDCVPIFTIIFFTTYWGRGGPKGNSAKCIIFTVFSQSFPYLHEEKKHLMCCINFSLSSNFLNGVCCEVWGKMMGWGSIEHSDKDWGGPTWSGHEVLKCLNITKYCNKVSSPSKVKEL